MIWIKSSEAPLEILFNDVYKLLDCTYTNQLHIFMHKASIDEIVVSNQIFKRLLFHLWKITVKFYKGSRVEF